ncbi:hypothetical protein DVH24_025881 [Malus domestica]|uniref:Uncharacterized protein n=1 Tax=Malus domestica TaxID=3750 RepID=A0A498KLV6_MALDO|nr:hypothetical protein DVH24_025881 [Malus domestica]
MDMAKNCGVKSHRLRGWTIGQISKVKRKGTNGSSEQYHAPTRYAPTPGKATVLALGKAFRSQRIP